MSGSLSQAGDGRLLICRREAPSPFLVELHLAPVQVIPTLHVPDYPMGHFPSSALYGDRKKPGRCKDAMSWGEHDQQGHQPRAASSASAGVLLSEKSDRPIHALCPSLQSLSLFHEPCDTNLGS